MIGIFNTITIDGKEIFRGDDFTLQREWIYAGEIETCTGKYCADIVGWRYAPLSIEWGYLPQDMLQKLLGLSGQAVNMTFSNEANETVTESVIPKVIQGTVTRHTDPAGNIAWTGIKLDIRFINAHND